MQDSIGPLLVVSIIFMVFLTIILIINTITYAEIYQKAIDQKNKMWGISMAVISLIGITALVIIMITLCFVKSYYGPTNEYQEHLKNQFELAVKNNPREK